jgi:hypothetical protein
VNYTKSFNPGTFTVTYVAKTNNTATVRVDGTVSGITRSIQQAFTKGGSGKPMAYSTASYTEHNISMGSGVSGDVYGPVSAGGTVTPSGVTFHDPVDQGNPDASVPTPDWAYWQGVANVVRTGNYTFNSGTYTGIYYVTGNVTFNGNSNTTLNGTVISRGRVTFGTNAVVHITPSGTNPAIYAQQRITAGSNVVADITGWVQSQEYITFGNNNVLNVTGGMASTGNITISKNSDVNITYDQTRAPTVGFSGGEPGGGLGESSWQEVF